MLKAAQPQRLGGAADGGRRRVGGFGEVGARHVDHVVGSLGADAGDALRARYERRQDREDVVDGSAERRLVEGRVHVAGDHLSGSPHIVWAQCDHDPNHR